MPPRHPARYRLDNAAHLFAAVRTARLPVTFRLSLTLDEPVDPALLQKALTMVIDRFPYYRVRMGRTAFWHHLVANPAKPRVSFDDCRYCRHFASGENDGFLFRTLYRADRIAVEFCHVLTDATGAMTFLLTLTAAYLGLRGHAIAGTEGLLALEEEPHPEEAEDAYKRYYQPAPPLTVKSPAFHPGGTLENPPIYHATTAVVPLPQALGLAKARHVSLTEFMVAVYLDVLQEMQRVQTKRRRIQPLRVTVPINARRILPSRTMRNFSLFHLVGIDPRLGEYDFAEILETVHHTMRLAINARTLRRMIRRNIRGEIHPLVQPIPLFLKKLIAARVFSLLGEDLNSGGLSNLGPLAMPEEMRRHVAAVEYAPSGTPINKYRCGMVSLHDKLYITIGRVCREKDLAELFFAALAKHGLTVQVLTEL